MAITQGKTREKQVNESADCVMVDQSFENVLSSMNW